MITDSVLFKLCDFDFQMIFDISWKLFQNFAALIWQRFWNYVTLVWNTILCCHLILPIRFVIWSVAPVLGHKTRRDWRKTQISQIWKQNIWNTKIEHRTRRDWRKTQILSEIKKKKGGATVLKPKSDILSPKCAYGNGAGRGWPV